MPYNIPNPNNYVFLTVVPPPSPLPEDLIYSKGGGTIFADLQADQTTGSFLYYGGNPILDLEDVSYFGDKVTATVTKAQVISAQKQKGLFEIRKGTPVSITGATNTPNAVLTVSSVDLSASEIVVGDYIEITGITSQTVPDGIYKVKNLTTNSIEIDFDSSSTPIYSASTAICYKLQYVWDEVYTTPLGLYQTSSSLTSYKFLQTASNEIQINISDVNIIPKVGDYFLIQKFFNNVNSFTNMSTTDGYNNVVNYPEADTMVLEITNVIAPSSSPNIYTIAFDKSFEANIGEYFMFVLLNRNGISVYKDLLTDVFQIKEVHREQLLGDPYDYIGTVLPEGRKNYLYYSGADFLGQVSLLDGILEPKNTPFIVLDAYDELRDRLHNEQGSIEIHLPTIMINGERTPLILTNFLPTLGPVNGVGTYSPLTIKYSSSTKKYGWVFYDLRIIVIDEPELAIAMAYNSNRNYTLPAPILTKTSNTIQNPTPSNPLAIANVTQNQPITVTTLTEHGLYNGDKVTIYGVTGHATVNNSAASPYWYVKRINNKSFEIYTDANLTSPVPNSLNAGTGGFLYGYKLPYEHFFTYKLKNDTRKLSTLPYSEVIPFNFQTANEVNNISGDVTIEIPYLTHLVDDTNLEGFLADTYEIIIGKYNQDLTNPYIPNKDRPYKENSIVVMGSYSLFSGSTQSLTKVQTLTATSYNNLVSTVQTLIANTTYKTDPNNPAYDILYSLPVKHYDVLSLPQTLYTAKGVWFLGNVLYKQHAEQYRLKLEVIIPADKWNASTNPTFEIGNPLMQEKFISEVAFYIQSAINQKTGLAIPGPYIYAKIAPAIKKNNQTDITLSIELDF